MKKASCRVTKNPCKICFQTVTKKNGVQCCGACQKWVHYECLNFTPGKIKDIKNGIIRIMCPCPDCTSEPKEILVNPPYTCANEKCPANNAPKCEDKSCPVNSGGMVCSKDECSKNATYNEEPMSQCEPPPQGDSCCGGSPQSPLQYEPPQSCCASSPQYGSPRRGSLQYGSPQYSPQLSPPQYGRPQKGNTGCPADACGSGHEVKLRQIHPAESNSSMERGRFTSQSCCCVSKAIGPGPTQSCLPPAPVKQSLSDSRYYFGKKDNRNSGSMECALEQMCKTVGVLTHQIKDLMCRMMDKRR